jgi:hypothetical protein
MYISYLIIYTSKDKTKIMLDATHTNLRRIQKNSYHCTYGAAHMPNNFHNTRCICSLGTYKYLEVGEII